MASFKKKIYNYQLRLLKRLFPVKIAAQHWTNLPYKKVGSHYGFVAVPDAALGPDAVVYSVGAGLDVHADVEMARTYGCRVFLFDPTPGAIRHFDTLREKTLRGEAFSSDTGENYEATPAILEKLVYKPWALWNKDETVQFFEPEQAHFISHSITDNFTTGRHIQVQARALPSIMQELGHSRLDYLKLDIEGAEFVVIEDLLKGPILPKVLYLEYHYDHNVSPMESIDKIKKSLSMLYDAGYKVYFESEKRYFGLIR